MPLARVLGGWGGLSSLELVRQVKPLMCGTCTLNLDKCQMASLFHRTNDKKLKHDI